MSGDMLAVLWTTVAVVLVTGAIGAMVLQAVRHRSLLLSIVVAALVPVAGVSAAVGTGPPVRTLCSPTIPGRFRTCSRQYVQTAFDAGSSIWILR